MRACALVGLGHEHAASQEADGRGGGLRKTTVGWGKWFAPRSNTNLGVGSGAVHSMHVLAIGR